MPTPAEIVREELRAHDDVPHESKDKAWQQKRDEIESRLKPLQDEDILDKALDDCHKCCIREKLFELKIEHKTGSAANLLSQLQGNMDPDDYDSFLAMLPTREEVRKYREFRRKYPTVYAKERKASFSCSSEFVKHMSGKLT